MRRTSLYSRSVRAPGAAVSPEAPGGSPAAPVPAEAAVDDGGAGILAEHTGVIDTNNGVIRLVYRATRPTTAHFTVETQNQNTLFKALKSFDVVVR